MRSLFKILFIPILTVLTGQSVYAQEGQPLTQEELRAIMDAAAQQANEKSNLARGGLSKEQVGDVMEEAWSRARTTNRKKLDLPLHLQNGGKKGETPDPSAIADEVRKQYMNQRPGEDLLIFVSTSLPPETLKRLGEQAAKAGGVLMLRGFKGGLKKGALGETMRAMRPIIETGAGVQIDPEAFSRFEISAVPTFVLAAPEPGCQPTEEQPKCAWQAAKLSGDVSLDYALEHWVRRGGRAGSIAQKYLDRMQPEQK